MKKIDGKGRVIWFTGLPGSGKSSIARGFASSLEKAGESVVYLQMDAQRKKYFPLPTYSSEERAKAYSLFGEEAAELTDKFRVVVLDGTAPRLSMREYARKICPVFAEIFVKCSLDTAMNREAARPEGLVMAGLYEKALLRKRTGEQFAGLGQVIGVDIEFEEDPDAECIIENERGTLDNAIQQTLDFYRSWTQ